MQKALIGAAVVALCGNAQFTDDDGEFIEDAEEELGPATPLNVSALTRQIEEQNDVCKKDFSKYMDKLDWQAKMKVAVQAMGMLKDVQTVGAESVYTKDEQAHRLRHCATMKTAKQRKMCQKMGSKLLQIGEINYMTFKGKRAFSNICKVQEKVESCQRSCELTHQFFKVPNEADCESLKEEWQDECVKVARGELVYREPTAEDKKLLKANRDYIRGCRKEHDEYQTQCANQLQSHLDRILSKRGNVKKSITQKIGKCFYRSLRNFTQCVKKAPDVPEGMEFQDVDPRKKNPLADILGNLAKQMKKAKKNRRRGRGGRSSWRNRRSQRGRGQTQPQEPNAPEDSLDFGDYDDLN